MGFGLKIKMQFVDVYFIIFDTTNDTKPDFAKPAPNI